MKLLLTLILMAAPAIIEAKASCKKPYADPEYEKVIAELYELAKEEFKEKGPLMVYEGGDANFQRKSVHDAFNARFPEIKSNYKMNYSKVWSVEVDKELKSELNADIVRMQTLADFDRWNKGEHLLPYKPYGFDKIPIEYHDKDGNFVATEILTLSPTLNRELYESGNYPLEADDFIKEEWKGKVTSTYPNSDDAVLYTFYKITQEKGIEYFDQLKSNNVTWVVGTQTAGALVGKGEFSAAITSFNIMKAPANSKDIMVLPNNTPFVSLPHTAAIFKKAKRPNMAKLFMTWSLGHEYQVEVWPQYPSRSDFPPPKGYKPLSHYSKLSDLTDYISFARNASLLIQFRDQVKEKVGDFSKELDPYNDSYLTDLNSGALNNA